MFFLRFLHLSFYFESKGNWNSYFMQTLNRPTKCGNIPHEKDLVTEHGWGTYNYRVFPPSSQHLQSLLNPHPCVCGNLGRREGQREGQQVDTVWKGRHILEVGAQGAQRFRAVETRGQSGWEEIRAQNTWSWCNYAGFPHVCYGYESVLIQP